MNVTSSECNKNKGERERAKERGKKTRGILGRVRVELGARTDDRIGPAVERWNEERMWMKHASTNIVCSFRAADPCDLFTNPGYCCYSREANSLFTQAPFYFPFSLSFYAALAPDFFFSRPIVWLSSLIGTQLIFYASNEIRKYIRRVDHHQNLEFI